jgi:hypothetical protein
MILFDPAARTITHWTEGETGAHVAIVVKLSAAQIDDAEKSASAMPPDALELDAGSTVTREDLGEKVIEGVNVAGPENNNDTAGPKIGRQITHN